MRRWWPKRTKNIVPLLGFVGLLLLFVLGGTVASVIWQPVTTEVQYTLIKSIEDNLYEFSLGNDAVEVGDARITDFKPHVKLNRWDGECSLTIKPAGDIEVEGEIEVEGDKVKSKYKVKQGEYEFELESEFYTLPPSEQYELGAFESNTILNERPPTNRLVFNFETQGLVLYHQPPLTQEYSDGWSEEFETNIIVSETQVRDADTLDVLVYRPENVVNSIAVYHATKQDHILGQTNYMAGKAFHLFRGQAVDSNGWQVWVDKFLDLDRHEIVYLIPYDFWLNAKYPIRHALGDTFGHTTIGGTTWGVIGADFIRGNIHAGAVGTGISITCYVLSANADDNYKYALYKNSDSTPVGSCTEISGTTEWAWKESNFISNPTLEAIDYKIVYWPEVDFSVKYDALALPHWFDNEAYNGWPNPATFSAGADRTLSIYCTYTLAADVTIEANTYDFMHYVTNSRSGIYWTSPTVGYAIYLDPNRDLVYRKTGDGGATWGGATGIQTGTIEKYDCWADWQTSGDAGTKIHIGYTDNATDDVRYCYLDTDGDTVGGDVQVEACQGTGDFQVAITRVSKALSITKTGGGNLAVAVRYVDTGATGFYSFYTSPDGAVWTSRADPWEAVKADYLILFPANLADADDLWGVYWDWSADEISLKTFDDSGNSWSEQLISGSMTENSVHLNFSGEIRLSDGHLILAAWSAFDNVNADLMVWDITDAGTITAKTNVLTNSAESGHSSVFINQDNDDIYVAYARGGTANNIMTVYYDKSGDGAGTWDGESPMQADVADDEKWISCGAVKAAWGGKFQPVWFNDDLNDLFTNVDNGISIAAAGAEEAGQVIIISLN